LSTDIADLRATIVPKSDQLNSEQLLGTTMTIRVTDVRVGGGDEQPVSIHYDNDGGRPFKPCKTMRKVLILAWGPDGRDWIGKFMTLYNDEAVRFGGTAVGGIRISHLSDIPRDIAVSLTATKGKKALHTIKTMQAPENAADQIANAATVDALKHVFGAAYKATKDAALRTRLKATYDARLAALTASGGKTLAEFRADVENATSAETASLVLDQAKDVLGNDDLAALHQAFAMAWE
jgi:hypothetical protein